MELECRLFLEKLGDQAKVVGNTNQDLYTMIEDWIQKVRSWHSGPSEDAWVAECSTMVATLCHTLLPVLNTKYEVQGQVQRFESARNGKETEIISAYDTMLQKLTSLVGTNPENHHHLQARQQSLLKWKGEKLEAIRLEDSTLRDRLLEVETTSRELMDKFITSIQQVDEPMQEAPANDPVMQELEKLMASCSTAMPPHDADGILHKATLQLGSSDTAEDPDLMRDAQIEQTPLDLLGDTPMPDPPKDSDKKDAAGAKDVEMVAATPEESALKHIEMLEAGPLKSALMSLCEASVSKAGYPETIIWKTTPQNDTYVCIHVYMYIISIHVTCTHSQQKSIT